MTVIASLILFVPYIRILFKWLFFCLMIFEVKGFLKLL